MEQGETEKRRMATEIIRLSELDKEMYAKAEELNYLKVSLAERRTEIQ